MAVNGCVPPPFEIDPERMNLSLNGCGYLGIYHVGVCSCIKKFYPQSLRRQISGGSVGALVACAFMCNVPLDVCAKYVFDVSMKVRNGILGPITPDLNIMKVLHESMDAMLPKDAHLRCNGKLHISATRFDTGTNSLLNIFNTREELLQALMCSCFIPLYCGYQAPKFFGVQYCDAALSNNSPWLNKHTVTVAPFSGNSDICPQNDGFFLKSLKLSNTSIGINAKNMYMLFRVLFPASPEVQKDICQQGYNDALRYLRDNNLIPCTNCTSFGPVRNHMNCKIPQDIMPVEISNEIERAVTGFRRRIGYRLFQLFPFRMLYYCNIPSIMTAKVTLVLISAILQKVQMKAGINMEEIWTTFLRALRNGCGSLNESNAQQISIREDVEAQDVENMDFETYQKEIYEAFTQQFNNVPENGEVGISRRNDVDRITENNNSSNGETLPKRNGEIKRNAIPMTSCQREFPHPKNNDTKVKEYMKTYVY